MQESSKRAMLASQSQPCVPKIAYGSREVIATEATAEPISADARRSRPGAEIYAMGGALLTCAVLGLTLGPVSGRLLAQLMTGEAPLVDPAPFRAELFGR